jgi:hypothetical protein
MREGYGIIGSSRQKIMRSKAINFCQRVCGSQNHERETLRTGECKAWRKAPSKRLRE